MRCFPRLKEVEDYRPAIFDLTSDAVAKRHWLSIFKHNILDIERIVREHRDGIESGRILLARQQFLAFLERMIADPDPRFPDVHAWSLKRDELLRHHLIPDPYKEVKDLENRRALELLPRVLRRIEELSDPLARLREITLNIFAGNMFDLGSALTAKAHREKGLDFEGLLEQIRARPWFIDDLVQFHAWIEGSSREGELTILFLTDNAGPDFLCGCVPLAMELASYGNRIIIGLNEKPALNDVTFDEGKGLLDKASCLSPILEELRSAGRIRLVSTGSSSAGIDLRQVSKEMAELAKGIDLFILEGQGRAVETNWNACFDVTCLRISTIKDSEVARYLGAQVYDVLFRFTRVD